MALSAGGTSGVVVPCVAGAGVGGQRPEAARGAGVALGVRREAGFAGVVALAADRRADVVVSSVAGTVA